MSENQELDAADPVDPGDLSRMRIDYSGIPFDVADLAPTWWEQLERWVATAADEGVVEPNAIVLATAAVDGRPASRNVLAKQIDASGLTFYTNYSSAKSADLTANPLASATFSWLPLHRQAHVRGSVQKVDAATTLAYWRTRPRGSQLGAWASPQSTVVPSRAALDALQTEVEQRFGGLDGTAEIPPPPHWGGWRIAPDTVEFWQGRSGRLHDRLRYRLEGVGIAGGAGTTGGAETADDAGADPARWVIERLAP